MVYSSAYPIYHYFNNTGGDIYYYISASDGTPVTNSPSWPIIYSGKISPVNNDLTITIDIAPIVREYLDVFYEKIMTDSFGVKELPASGLIKSMNQFAVFSSNNRSSWYNVKYDYNTDYISELADIDYLNDPIDFNIDPRQSLFFSAYNTDVNGFVSYTFNFSDGTGFSSTNNGNNNADIQYIAYKIGDLKPLNPGEYIKVEAEDFSDTGNPVVVRTDTYTVVEPCPNNFVLYYVNKYGGLDSLLCRGKYVESWNPAQTDVRIYKDRTNRQESEQKRIFQEITHQWQLNTGFLKWENMKKIDHIIYSPKVFLHDLNADTITSVMITDTQYGMKYRLNGDKPFYTINVAESQKQIRM